VVEEPASKIHRLKSKGIRNITLEPDSQNFPEMLLQQVFRDDDALYLVGPFVDLSALSELSTASTKPVIVRRTVLGVHAMKSSSSEL
jgi:hypothetical protein